MTNTPDSDRDSSPSKDLGFDEFIAIFVAFTTIGAILWWSLSRQTTGWQFNKLLSTTPKSSSVSPKSSLDDLQASLFPTPTATPTTGSADEGDSPEIAGVMPIPSIRSQKKVTTPKSTSPWTSKSPQVDSSAILPVPLPDSTKTPDATAKTPDATAKTPDATVKTPDATAKTPGATTETPANKKSTIPPPIAFTDIPPNFWGNRFINILSSRGMVGGFPDYTFRPNQPVNRAQFAAMLQRAIDKQVPQAALNFKDVSEDFWGKNAIQKGIGTGFLRGYPDQNFKPDQKIPRVQVLVALASGLNLPIPNNPESILSIYKDAKDIPKYAIGKVAAATVNQLVVVESPEQQLLLPNKEATRGEVAAMIHQTLVRMKKLSPIQSPHIVRPQNNS